MKNKLEIPVGNNTPRPGPVRGMLDTNGVRIFIHDGINWLPLDENNVHILDEIKEK